MEEKRITPTYNGVKGVPGIEAGFIVATYNGVPIIPSKDVQTDVLSRMYFLDTDYLYFSQQQFQPNTLRAVLKLATRSLSTASDKKECTELWVNYGRLSSVDTVQSVTSSDGG